MLKSDLPTPLFINIMTSKNLSNEYKQKLIRCIRFLEQQPEMKDILSVQPYDLTFQVQEEPPFTTDFDETSNTVILDKLYFINTPEEDLALALSMELCHANQKEEGRSYISNKLYFEETMFVAKMCDLEANLKIAQIAYRLHKKHPLGDIYGKLVQLTGEENAPTEMSKILWNGLLPEELKEFSSFVEEQIFADNMTAYHKAYQIFGPVEKPLVQTGTRTPDEINLDYIKRLNLNLSNDWFSQGENYNIIVSPHFYITKDMETDTIKSFTVKHPISQCYTSVLEVHEDDYQEPTRFCIYENNTYLCDQPCEEKHFVFELFTTQVIKNIQANHLLSAEQLNQIAMGYYLTFYLSCGALEDTKRVLERYPQLINFKDKDGMPLICIAAAYDPKNETGIIPYLLSKNPDLHQDNDITYYNLLVLIKDKSLTRQIMDMYYKPHQQKIDSHLRSHSINLPEQKTHD